LACVHYVKLEQSLTAGIELAESARSEVEPLLVLLLLKLRERVIAHLNLHLRRVARAKLDKLDVSTVEGATD
jgi:hypothetical protein